MNQSGSFDFGRMVGQSLSVLTRPAVSTFERYERGGGVREAFVYVLVAAVVSAIIAAIFAPFHREVTFFGQLITRLILIPLGFFVFTGAVYWTGKSLFGGTGKYAEVAYTYALFYVPLSILGSLLGIIPLLGWLIELLIAVALVYFGWLAVQSGMNIRNQGQAAIALVVAGLVYLLVRTLLAALIVAPFVLNNR